MIYKVSMGILTGLTLFTMGLYIMGHSGLYPILMVISMWSLVGTRFMFSKKHPNKWAGIIAYVSAFIFAIILLRQMIV